MSELNQVRLISAWGLPAAALVSSAGNRVSAVRWQHSLRELNGTGAPANTLVYMLSNIGSALHRGGRRTDASASAGGLGLLPTGTEGNWTFERSIDCVHLYVPDANLAELAEQSELSTASLDLKLELHDPFLALLMREVAEVLSGSDRCKLYLDALGATAAMRLLRRHSNKCGAAQQPLVKGGLAPWQLKRLTDHLEDRIGDDVTLNDLSQLLGLSTFHLCRAFKQSTGLPPHRWRMQRRIERAREMLEGTELPVTEIAARVGFEDPSGFAAAFRKALGVSPSEYRRERRS